VAIHTVVRGAVPTTISKEGFTWAQEATKATHEELESVRAQLESLGLELTEFAGQLAPGRGNPS